jgi:hypothetical protein
LDFGKRVHGVIFCPKWRNCQYGRACRQFLQSRSDDSNLAVDFSPRVWGWTELRRVATLEVSGQA